MDELSDEDLANPNLQGLEVGDLAPDFEMIDVCNPDGKMFHLSEEAKKHRGVFLVFFRGEF